MSTSLSDRQKSVATGCQRPDIQYYTASPNGDTFQNEKIRSWVLSWVRNGDRVLDACAKDTVLPLDNLHRNDLDKDTDTDSTIDVRELSEHFDRGVFDVIVYDPPYTPEKSKSEYGGCPYPGYHEAVKDEIDYVLGEEGRLIQLGFTAVGMPPTRYSREAISIINTFGRGRDWVGIVDQKFASGERCEALGDHWQDQPAQTVPINAGHGTRTDVGNTEDLSIGITYLDSLSADQPWTVEPIMDTLSDYIEGRVLYAISDQPSPSAQDTIDELHNDGRLNRSRTITGFTTDSSPDTRIPVTDLADVYANVFDTVVYNPPASYFSRCLFDDDGTNLGGVGKKARQAIDTILKPGGKVIQFGRTTTNMPGEKDYTRDAVHVFAPLGTGRYSVPEGPRYTPKTEFLTVDRKPGSKGQWPAPQHVACVHCGDRFPADMQAVHRACPECSACHDSYCADRERELLLAMPDGTPILHQARQDILTNYLREIQSGNCPCSPDGTHTVSPEEIVCLDHFPTIESN